jgi:hypothetical protein
MLFAVIFLVLIRSKEEDWRYVWRDEVVEKRFRIVDAEKVIRRTVGCKNKEQWKKIGIPMMVKYKEK